VVEAAGFGTFRRVAERRRGPVAHVQAATDRFSRAAGLPIWFRDMVLPVIGPRSYRETYGSLRQPVELAGQ
jgi:hypothetical protein